MRRGAAENRVAILMYHGIGDLQKDGRHPYFETATSSRVFATQMAFLRANGYRVAGLNDFLGVLSDREADAGKCVVITFDDGLADFKTHALPILESCGFSCTVFLPAGLIGKTINGRACMTWSQVRDAAAVGTVFGSHSLTHPKLSELGPNEMDLEVRCSKEKIEYELGKNIDAFSCPYAFPEMGERFRKFYQELLEKCGYQFGVTTNIGNAMSMDNPYLLKRLPVNDHDDTRFFQAKLEGGYNWLHIFQKAFKRAKRLARAR